MLRILLLACACVASFATNAQGIDFMAIERGRQAAQDRNYLDELRGYDPNAAMAQEQMWQQQQYQQQMLEQQRRQNELLEQQFQQQQLWQQQQQLQGVTTDCYRNAWGGVQCTSR